MGQDVKRFVSFTNLLQKKLAPVDTVHAVVSTEGGHVGTFCVSFGTEFKSGFEIEVVTTNGAVSVFPTEVRVVQWCAVGRTEVKKHPSWKC